MTRSTCAAASLSTVLLCACGSSSGPIKNVSPTTTRSAAGMNTFTAPGMALSFQFPSEFRTISLSPAQRVVGNSRQATRAAVGVGPFDLLVVVRYPNRKIPVTAQNIAGLRGAFDRALSEAFGTPMVSRISTVGGLPALAYAPVPAPGLPVSATSRNTLVFVGDDEYQLICQYRPPARATINAACDQMLATLRTTR